MTELNLLVGELLSVDTDKEKNEAELGYRRWRRTFYLCVPLLFSEAW